MSTAAVQLLWTRSTEPWDEATLQAARDRVPDALLDAMPRYRRWQDVQMGLCGKLLLARVLLGAGLDPTILAQMSWSDTKRPSLPLDGDFNLSHSGGLIACAYSPDVRLGLDVELVRQVPLEDIVQALSPEERSTLHAATNSDIEFFRIWTFKEAVIKADGRGVGLDLPAIDSLGDRVRVDDSQWHVRRLQLHDGYDAHLASDRAELAVDSREVTLDELLTCQ